MIDCSSCSQHNNCQDIKCPLHTYWRTKVLQSKRERLGMFITVPEDNARKNKFEN
jgi:hypothetical protein